jgi:hypothetical protein
MADRPGERVVQPDVPVVAGDRQGLSVRREHAVRGTRPVGEVGSVPGGGDVGRGRCSQRNTISPPSCPGRMIRTIDSSRSPTTSSRPVGLNRKPRANDPDPGGRPIWPISFPSTAWYSRITPSLVATAKVRASWERAISRVYTSPAIAFSHRAVRVATSQTVKVSRAKVTSTSPRGSTARRLNGVPTRGRAPTSLPDAVSLRCRALLFPLERATTLPPSKNAKRPTDPSGSVHRPTSRPVAVFQNTSFCPAATAETDPSGEKSGNNASPSPASNDRTIFNLPLMAPRPALSFAGSAAPKLGAGLKKATIPPNRAVTKGTLRRGTDTWPPALRKRSRQRDKVGVR